MRTKADFRALRERVGLSQLALADYLGVSTRTVKRWESPDWSDPPADAWGLLDEALARQDAIVDAAIDAAVDAASRTGAGSGMGVELSYFRGQAHMIESGRDDGYFGMSNAAARRVAEELRRLGFKPRFSYPEEAGPARGRGDGRDALRAPLDTRKAARPPDGSRAACFQRLGLSL